MRLIKFTKYIGEENRIENLT